MTDTVQDSWTHISGGHGARPASGPWAVLGVVEEYRNGDETATVLYLIAQDGAEQLSAHGSVEDAPAAALTAGIVHIWRDVPAAGLSDAVELVRANSRRARVDGLNVLLTSEVALRTIAVVAASSLAVAGWEMQNVPRPPASRMPPTNQTGMEPLAWSVSSDLYGLNTVRKLRHGLGIASVGLALLGLASAVRRG